MSEDAPPPVSVPTYAPPSESEPHALVKVRLIYLQASQRLQQHIAINGMRFYPPSEVTEDDCSFAVRVHPGVTSIRFSAALSQTKKKHITTMVPCGATPGGGALMCEHEEVKKRRVVDEDCTAAVTWPARAGSTYLVAYSFFGDQSCASTCVIESVQGEPVACETAPL